MVSVKESRSSPIRNRILTVIFAGLCTIQASYLLVGLASLPLYYQRVSTQTVEPALLYEQVFSSNQIVAQAAANRNMPLPQYALYRNVFNAISALFPAAVALLIIWRARWHWFAWFTAFIIFFLSNSALNDQITVARLIPLQVVGLNDIFWFLLYLFLFLFPNGQVVPRRVGWIVIGLVIYHFFIQAGTVAAYVAPEFAAQNHIPNWGDNITAVPVLANFLIILACQIYRFRRASTLMERQQTKWFVFGLGIVIGLVPIAILGGAQSSFLTDFSGVALWIPLALSLAVAILRYRLFDIDIIIRRTLVYSAITTLLALIYFGSVLGLQSIFTAVTGQQSGAAVVISTLAIAALFFPLRDQVQMFIDRQFYRRKYDAAKTLATFAATARDETDLDTLVARLVETVDSAMQPESIGLWLTSAVKRQGRDGDSP